MALGLLEILEPGSWAAILYWVEMKGLFPMFFFFYKDLQIKVCPLMGLYV